MPEVGTIEEYILNAHTKFEDNWLNRTRDFISTKLIKYFRENHVSNFYLFFSTQIFFLSSWNINKNQKKWMVKIYVYFFYGARKTPEI